MAVGIVGVDVIGVGVIGVGVGLPLVPSAPPQPAAESREHTGTLSPVPDPTPVSSEWTPESRLPVRPASWVPAMRGAAPAGGGHLFCFCKSF